MANIHFPQPNSPPLTLQEKGENIVGIKIIIIGDASMNKFFHQHRTTLSLVALSILLIFLGAAHYGLVPLSRWVSNISPIKTISVTAVPLGTSNKPLQILRTGVVESPKSAPVQAEFPGRISQVYVTEGQVVKADQPLVQIIRSSTNNAQAPAAAPIYQNEGASPQAQANYDNALKDYNRFQKLYEQGAIAKRQLDTAEIRLQTATEMLATSPAPQAVQPSSNNGYQSPSSPITLTALTPGTVTGLSAVIGNTVELGQQLLIVAVGEIQVVIHIDQKDLYLLHAGTPATIEIAGHKTLGQVASIYPEIGANNVSSFRTHISIPINTDGVLKTGMSVNATINTNKSIPVRTLPASAVLQSEDGTRYIYLINNGKAQRQEITIGEVMGDLIEITSNLPEQALIITSNTNVISPGDMVTVQN